MKNGTLFIFSGLPGSGKSTLASRLASQTSATYLRVDTIEQGLRDICDISQIDGKGYRLMYRIAQENLLHGISVVADSVNPWNLTRKEWNQVAEEVRAPFVNIEVLCSNQDEHRKRVENRRSSIPGFTLPTWKDVLARDYQNWTLDRLRLETSGKSEDQSFERLLALLEGAGHKC